MVALDRVEEFYQPDPVVKFVNDLYQYRWKATAKNNQNKNVAVDFAIDESGDTHCYAPGKKAREIDCVDLMSGDSYSREVLPASSFVDK
jgi:hypothetical protein